MRKMLIVVGCYCFFPLMAQETLRHYADERGKNIGSAVTSSFFSMDSTNIYVITLKREFNMLVAENAMKFNALESKHNVFDFTYADQLVQFALDNNMKVRGHCLVWHQQLPGWISTLSFPNSTYRDTLLKVMKNHITTVVSHYKGKVSEWDVVNEAVDENQPDYLRKTIWRNVIGSDYIDSAFVYARRADSSALLFYNDYNAEHINNKSNAIYNLVKGMKSRGIPIDGVGLQCHFDLGLFYPDNIEKNIRRLDTIGLLANITELDIGVPSNALNAKKYYIQAQEYGGLMQMCLRNENVKSFVMWGYTDRYSWVPNHTGGLYGGALIFDISYKPKQAYYALLDTLAERTIPRDCNGDLNGSAIIDSCNVCSGGNTGIEINSTCKQNGLGNELSFEQRKFIIYPNPASKMIKITFLQDNLTLSNILIIDLLGKYYPVKKTEGKAIEVDISSIPCGIYILSLIGSDNSRYNSLISIQHK